MKKKGFDYVAIPVGIVNVKFMDLKGKDAGVARYRIDCYYEDGRAFTVFKYTAEDYYRFIADHIAACYETYEEFKARKTNEQAIEEVKAGIQDTVVKLNNLHTKLSELEKEL